MTTEPLFSTLDLHLFDGEGGGVAATAGAGDAAEAAQQDATQDANNSVSEIAPKESDTITTASTAQDRRARFEELIKGEYKDLFDERAQKIVTERFKNVKSLEKDAQTLKSLSPILDMLAGKYGVDRADTAGLLKAIEDDDAYYEDEAMEKGLTVQQLKQFKQIERENAEFRRAIEDQNRQRRAEEVYSRWMTQSDDTKRFYPQFDLRAELNNPDTGERFVSLLKSNVDVKTAYEVIHKDELVGGAMQYAARVTEQRTVENIRSRGTRPAENGGNRQAAAVMGKRDVNTLTKKDRDELARRAMRGERIEF